MDIYIRDIPYGVNQHALKRKIASMVHADDFPLASKDPDQRLINFSVWLNPSKIGRAFSDGTGKITFPSAAVGHAFLDYVVTSDARKWDDKKLRFKKATSRPHNDTVEILTKAPYIDPDKEELHEEKVSQLDERIRVNEFHIGILYRSYAVGTSCLTFSSEWKRDLTQASVGWLKFEYDFKLLRLKIGDPNREDTGYGISVLFSNINKILVGYELGSPYLVFDLATPPVLEVVDFHADPESGREGGVRRRVSAIHAGHERIAPYAHQLRLVLYNKSDTDVIQDFIRYCRVSEIEAKVELLEYPAFIESHGAVFLMPKQLNRMERWLKELPFSVSFQVEALHRSGLLNTRDLLEGDLYRAISNLAGYDSETYSDLLRRFYEALELRPEKETPWQCYQRVKKEFTYVPMELSAGNFRCCHVTVTPTRLLLEGPYATQSNRVLRKYKDFPDNFMRVDFRDEDRLQYRWDYRVDGTELLRLRVGGFLKDGLEIAGRRFEFLAYSSSALREHAVWFMQPFEKNGKLVNPEVIRSGLGEFTELIKQPSKLAARVAQGFTATDPSVNIRRNQWEIVDDLLDSCDPPNTFTDGCGIISMELGDKIWAELSKDRPEAKVKPWVYQIRFLGFKGVVCVCPELDNRETNPKGIMMRLHRSMKKFENTSEEESPIEIARAFNYPNVSHLNRPLVMILEDRGVRRDTFLRLQKEAVKDIKTIDESMDQFHLCLRTHSLCPQFSWMLPKIKTVLGLELRPDKEQPGADNPFLQRLRSVAQFHVLRDIKYRARLPIPNSWMLVGVADEGPLLKQSGYQNVYLLPDNHIYACIQREEDDEPIWLQGNCLISRNPVVHPGDIQRVFAIGKPPPDQFCAFRGVVNAVVLPSQGRRSLASCLAGGDVDGDTFDILQYGPLLEVEHCKPAVYTAVGVKTLDRECTTNDICDFIVEYIHSDVLGLLSTRHLTIADQSKEGSKDPNCIALAKLCSQAVDYPKNGIPVDTSHIPRKYLKYDPDWRAAEVSKPRETDFYRSDRALGFLYRAISLDGELPEIFSTRITPMQDPISIRLSRLVKKYIQPYVDFQSVPIAVDEGFKRYTDELRYISTTHTITTSPSDRLTEEEMIMGTILANCSQTRWRSDRSYRMRLHVQTLVQNVKGSIFKKVDGPVSTEERLLGLRNAWDAWVYSQHRSQAFGANSFGLIALGMIFNIYEELEMDIPIPASNGISR